MDNLDTKYETGVWYGWNGGPCPVHPETVVEVAWSVSAPTAHHRPHKAGQWNWSTGQIVSFRIVTPYVEPAPKLECCVYTDQDGKIMGETRIDQMQVAEVMARHYGGRVVRMVEATK